MILLACNYAKGKWVGEKKRPLYSGFGCKQWLSEPWSCRLTQRTDFSYEKFKWKPESCDMPEFEGSKFLRRCGYFFVVILYLAVILMVLLMCVCPRLSLFMHYGDGGIDVFIV